MIHAREVVDLPPAGRVVRFLRRAASATGAAATGAQPDTGRCRGTAEARCGRPELKRLLEKAIEEGRQLNPDPETNPAQTLEQYYQFVRFAEGATPANLIKHAPDATLYKRIDQSLGYLYFISDIPLDELGGRAISTTRCSTWIPTTRGCRGS
ncbi:MAG: hypothetical protein IPM70_05470 [Proteobacteria bacterium]|nr:hypothetical protein [Pseudomonadota bacterium]